MEGRKPIHLSDETSSFIQIIFADFPKRVDRLLLNQKFKLGRFDRTFYSHFKGNDKKENLTKGKPEIKNTKTLKKRIKVSQKKIKGTTNSVIQRRSHDARKFQR